MEIKFLGTGGAFDWKVGNSAAILDFRGKRILIDCGHSVFPKLMELDLGDTIDYLLLTHLHDDHCGSSATFIFAQYFLTGKRPFPILAATPDFAHELRAYFSHAFIEVDRFADVRLVENELPGIKTLDTTGLHFEGMRTYGFIFEEAGKHLIYSGDIGDAHFVFRKLKEYGINNATVFHDLSFFEVPTHAFYKELVAYSHQYQLYGYHHDPSLNPEDNPIQLVHHCPDLRLY
jgi:ribonuclease BN (tRNA processing enzyme)